MSSRLLYFRLLQQFRPYLWIAGVTLIAVALAAAADVLLIRQLQNVVDALAPSHSLLPARPATGLLAEMQAWLGRLLPQNPAHATLWAIPAVILALAIMRMVSSFAAEYGAAWLSSRVQANLREVMFARIMRLPNGYFDQSSTGTTLSRVAFDAAQVAQAVITVVNVAMRDSVATIGYLTTDRKSVV